MGLNQYYEFRAIDSEITAKKRELLRSFSSRAEITESTFSVEYHFGNFKGDQIEWMREYFDAHLYHSNCGARKFYLKFPKEVLNKNIINQYFPSQTVELIEANRYYIISYQIDNYYENNSATHEDKSLVSFLELRKDILFLNDYRLFYLGWLLAVQEGKVSLNSLEPPIPYGLQSRSAPLKEFVSFFGIDQDLINEAAKNSTKETMQICSDDIEPVISGLCSSEKNSWLERFVLEDNKNLGAEFRRLILDDNSGIEIYCETEQRTVKEILEKILSPNC